jgi:hypothetical protein
VAQRGVELINVIAVHPIDGKGSAGDNFGCARKRLKHGYNWRKDGRPDFWQARTPREVDVPPTYALLVTETAARDV